MLVFPGGAYGHWCGEYEGVPVAAWFASNGVTAVCVRYRTPRPAGLAKHTVAWADGQRAVRLVRRDAKAHGVDPEKIGAVGFSAGGHLTLMLATTSKTSAYPRVDAVDDLPVRLQFAAPVYPAYILSDGLDNTNAYGGEGPEVTMTDDFAFDDQTPPICLLHGQDDRYSPLGSTAVYRRLRERKIPAELHLFSSTGHGFAYGCRKGIPNGEFKQRILEWMTRLGFGPHPDRFTQVEGEETDGRLKVEEKVKVEGQGKVRGAIERSEIAERSVGLREQWTDKTSAVQSPTSNLHPLFNFNSKLQLLSTPLWPEGKIPDAVASQNGAPEIRWHEPLTNTTAGCVILVSGGTYDACRSDGERLAAYFTAKGMTVAALKCRTLSSEGQTYCRSALQDVQRAVRLVRSQAQSHGFVPNRIGMIGFAASARLAALCAAHSQQWSYRPVDDIDNKVSCALDWAVLAQGADEEEKVGGESRWTEESIRLFEYSINRLIDCPHPSSDRLRGSLRSGDIPPLFSTSSLSSILYFDTATPPMCIFHDDAGLSDSMESVRLWEHCRRCGIPADLHVFAQPTPMWLDRVWEFLTFRHLNSHP